MALAKREPGQPRPYSHDPLALRFGHRDEVALPLEADRRHVQLGELCRGHRAHHGDALQARGQMQQAGTNQIF